MFRGGSRNLGWGGGLTLFATPIICLQHPFSKFHYQLGSPWGRGLSPWIPLDPPLMFLPYTTGKYFLWTPSSAFFFRHPPRETVHFSETPPSLETPAHPPPVKNDWSLMKDDWSFPVPPYAVAKPGKQYTFQNPGLTWGLFFFYQQRRIWLFICGGKSLTVPSLKLLQDSRCITNQINLLRLFVLQMPKSFQRSSLQTRIQYL